MRIDRRALHEALKHICRVSPTRQSLPALSHVLIEAKDGIAKLTATDLETSLAIELPAQGELTACVPAKQLKDVVRPESKKQRGEVIIDPILGRQVLVALDGARTRLTCFEPVDFPSWPVTIPDRAPPVVWDGDWLRRTLDYVLPAVSHDPTRANLGNVYFAGNRVVATDGHRLHRCEMEQEFDKLLLVPGASARVLAKLATSGPVELAQFEEGWAFSAQGWSLAFRDVDAQFPDHSRVIPDANSCTTQIVVKGNAFRRELERLHRLAKDCCIRATVNGHISLTICDADGNEAAAVVEPIENNHRGDDLVIGFDPGYLLDALPKKVKEETVKLGFTNSAGPVRIDLPDERLAVVMPMRL